MEPGKVVRDRGALALAAIRGSGLVMILGKPFVQGEAFKDVIGGLIWGQVIEVCITGEAMETLAFYTLKTGEHDLSDLARFKKPVD
ncbi:MAG: hypothetical protein ACREJ4_03880, partial [Candidatus Methylomirabilaceae bacterium]